MTTTKELQVPWLLAPIWKNFPMTKGLNHHRIPIGIILPPYQDILIHITSEDLDSITIRLFNDDTKTEENFEVKNPNRSAILCANSLSVPFIDCEYLEQIPSKSRTITIEYPSVLKLLPIFRYGDDENEFFELWDSQEAEFAYIESDYFSLLIPERDKEHARSLENGNHLDDLIVFYDEIFSIYHKLIGLSLEKYGTNRNVRNRFFLKADKSGAGAAYYCDWCTAESTESVRNFWFDLNATNWGALHEIGHGHELKSLSDETFSTSEVWNNVLVVFYQYIMMGDEIITKGGLSRESTKIDEHLKEGKPVKEWGLFQKLSFLMHMFFRAGSKSFTRFNELMRKEWAGELHYASGTNILERLMHLFAIDFELDVYPFMKLANAMISDEQLIQHYYAFSEIAYPLNYLICDQSLLDDMKQKLRLLYDTSLVTPLDLRKTNLKNSFTLQIDDSIFRALFGEIIRIMDGYRIVAEKRIIHQTVTFDNLPIGVYKIFIPSNPLNNKYILENFYAVIPADKPETNVLSAKLIENSTLLHEKIKFLGLGDEPFATLSVDILKNLINFHVFSDSPHCYFKGETYVKINIQTLENKTIFDKTIEGTNCEVGLFDIPILEILKIEIFHAETRTRLKTEHLPTNGIINPDTETNIFFVTKLGFRNANASKLVMASRLLNRIENAANKIRSLPFIYSRSCCYPKHNLLLAIETFKILFKGHSICHKIEDKYKDCLPPEVSTVTLEALVNLNRCFMHEVCKDDDFYEITQIASGKQLVLLNRLNPCFSFKLKFFGLGDHHIATLKIDTTRSIILFNILLNYPHDYYAGTTYYGITIRNNKEDIIFSKKVEGMDTTVEKFEIPLITDFKIDIFHAEIKNRLVTDNSAIEGMIDRSNSTNTFRITKNNKTFTLGKNNIFKKRLLKRKHTFLTRSKSMEHLLPCKSKCQNML